MSTRRALTAVVLSASLLLPGRPAVAQDAPLVDVVVQNHGYYDMHIYAVQSGSRQTIGFVSGVSTQTLELPRTYVESAQDVQIYADPIAGPNAFLSQRLVVWPGDRIVVTLHTNGDLSTATVMDQPSEEDSDAKPDSGQSSAI